MSSSRVAPCPIALRTCWRMPGSNRCVAAASIASRTSSLTLGSSGPLRHGHRREAQVGLEEVGVELEQALPQRGPEAARLDEGLAQLASAVVAPARRNSPDEPALRVACARSHRISTAKSPPAVDARVAGHDLGVVAGHQVGAVGAGQLAQRVVGLVHLGQVGDDAEGPVALELLVEVHARRRRARPSPRARRCRARSAPASGRRAGSRARPRRSPRRPPGGARARRRPRRGPGRARRPRPRGRTARGARAGRARSRGRAPRRAARRRGSGRGCRCGRSAGG